IAYGFLYNKQNKTTDKHLLISSFIIYIDIKNYCNPLSSLFEFWLFSFFCVHSFLVITSSTRIFTSTTSRPVIYFTCSLTKSVSLRKIFGADSPYSKITFESTAACFSPTSTLAPCVTLLVLPNELEMLSTNPPFISKMPFTSRAAIPAIFSITSSEKVNLLLNCGSCCCSCCFCCCSCSFSFTPVWLSYACLALLLSTAIINSPLFYKIFNC